MILQLPPAIAEYFRADRAGDIDAILTCFTEDALVRDEGKMNQGHDAVRAWKAKSSAAYNYVSEPFAATSDGDQTIVTSRLTGDFPGSPLDLRYFFTLRASKIAVLEIKP
jgi:ketosteroid isomerase-like protein